MPDINFDNVRPLIARAEPNGATMQCTFKCPASGATVDASAAIQKGRGIADLAKSSAKRSLMYSLRRSVLGAVRSVLGYGLFGRVGRDIASQLISDVSRKADHSYSDDEKNAAIVSAFQNVSSQFVWDSKNGRWVAASAAGDTVTDFSKQLSKAPVTEKYDRGVLARMLVEVANADGKLASEEKAFLNEFITPDLGTVDDLAGKGKLSAAELGETNAAGRDTMLMLAWAVALTDEELASEEAQRIQEQAQGLGIAGARAAELKQWAQIYVIDQALENAYAGGVTDAAKREVMTLAQGIGLDPETAERVDIRYRKRNGLV